MSKDKKSPKLPGEDDSWESLATNLFGINFNPPALPDEDLSFDLKSAFPSSSSPGEAPSDVPPDEDVQLAASSPEEDEDGEAGFSEDEEAGFPEDELDESDLDFSVEISTETLEEADFGDLDDEEEELVAEELEDFEEELDEEEAEELEDAEEDEADTYWEALNEFEWDTDEDREPKKSGESRGPRKPRRSSDRKDKPKREPKPAPPVEIPFVEEEVTSAADYYKEYDDSDFGDGLVEEVSRTSASSRIVEDDDDLEDSPVADGLDEDEPAPERKRRRRRRRRKPRGDASEKSTAGAKPPEEAISLDDMDFESMPEDADEDVDEPAPVAERKEETSSRRSRSRNRRPKPEPAAEADAFFADDVEEEEKPSRGKPSRHRSEKSEAKEEAGDSERPRKERSGSSSSKEKDPYRNIPTWEEAISYLIHPKKAGSNTSKPEGDSGTTNRPAGRRRRRRS